MSLSDLSFLKKMWTTKKFTKSWRSAFHPTSKKRLWAQAKVSEVQSCPKVWAEKRELRAYSTSKYCSVVINLSTSTLQQVFPHQKSSTIKVLVQGFKSRNWRFIGEASRSTIRACSLKAWCIVVTGINSKHNQPLEPVQLMSLKYKDSQLISQTIIELETKDKPFQFKIKVPSKWACKTKLAI